MERHKYQQLSANYYPEQTLVTLPLRSLSTWKDSSRRLRRLNPTRREA